MAVTAPSIVSALDFVEQEDERVPFLVEPFFPAGGLCYFHGKGGAGKSFVANSLMCAVADGLPFLGKFSTAQGKVVYVEADMTPATHRGRIRKAILTVAHPENIRIMAWEGPFDIEQAVKGRHAWLAALHAEAADLVIVDTVRKTHRNKESDNDWPAIYYAIWKEIVGRSALFFISHDNKTQNQESRSDDDRARGARAWIDDADAAIRLVKMKGGTLSLRWSKVRTCDELDPLTLCIDDDTQMAAIDPAATLLTATLNANPGRSNHEIARILLNHPDIHVKERTLMRRLARLRPEGLKGCVTGPDTPPGYVTGVDTPQRLLAQRV